MNQAQIQRLHECESAVEQLDMLERHLQTLNDSVKLGASVSMNVFGNIEQRIGVVQADPFGKFATVHSDDWNALKNTIATRRIYWASEIEKI